MAEKMRAVLTLQVGGKSVTVRKDFSIKHGPTERAFGSSEENAEFAVKLLGLGSLAKGAYKEVLVRQLVGKEFADWFGEPLLLETVQEAIEGLVGK